MQAIEAALGSVSFLSRLRVDEIGRIAKLFETETLELGERRALGVTSDAARLVIVVFGEVAIAVDDPTGKVAARMRQGDRYGVTAVLTGYARPFALTAKSPASLALLDRAGLDLLLAQYPAVALWLAAELASEVRIKNDEIRQLLELRESGLAREQLEAAVRRRRRLLAMRGVSVRRLAMPALFRRLVMEPGREPPFWMLAGFLLALAGARLVVFLILKYRLERQLFALVYGPEPNPLHIHHFNYGLILVGIAGVAALMPLGRRTLRLFSLVFGAGCGLIFDEFALFWNLNPDYSQGLSLISATLIGVILVQLTYFRGFWLGLARRLAQKLWEE